MFLKICKIFKNTYFEEHLRTTSEKLFFVVRLSHCCELKLDLYSPIIIFSTVVWPPPCTARCVLISANISYFNSASVALGLHLNAASKRNNTDRIYIHMFYIQRPINFLISSLKTTPPPLTNIILMNRIRLLIEAVSHSRPSAHSSTLRGHKFFKKGQLQGRLKQLSLEQDPTHNTR